MNANDTTLLELVTKVLDDNKAENVMLLRSGMNVECEVKY